MYAPPILTILNDKEFELVEPFSFKWFEEDGSKYKITIPKGYIFDGASVPRFCWSLTGLIPTGIHMGAALVHDYSYQRRGRLIRSELEKEIDGKWCYVSAVWDRKQCDDMFSFIMEAGGVTPWKRIAMYRAVRWFGGKAWNN